MNIHLLPVVDHADAGSVIAPAAAGLLPGDPAHGGIGLVRKVKAANRHDGALGFAPFGALGGGLSGAARSGFGGFLRGSFRRLLRRGFGGFLRGSFRRLLRRGFGGFLRGSFRRLLRGGFGGFLRGRFVHCARCCHAFIGRGSVCLGSRRRRRGVRVLRVGGQPKRQGQGGAGNETDKNSFLLFIHRGLSLE